MLLVERKSWLRLFKKSLENRKIANFLDFGFSENFCRSPAAFTSIFYISIQQRWKWEFIHSRNCRHVFQLKLFSSLSLALHPRNLNGNKIQQIPSGLFDKATSLRSLQLERNPLSCNCNMMWLPRYLQANRRLLSATGNCIVSTSPAKKRLNELRESDFQCSWVEFIVFRFN